MVETVNLELVERIRSFLQQQGDQGSDMQGFVRNVDFDDHAIGRSLIYMEDNGELYHIGQASPTWYLKTIK